MLRTLRHRDTCATGTELRTYLLQWLFVRLGEKESQSGLSNRQTNGTQRGFCASEELLAYRVRAKGQLTREKGDGANACTDAALEMVEIVGF